MESPINLARLVEAVRASDNDFSGCVHKTSAARTPMYANFNLRLGIDFAVERLACPGTQTMDPRIVRIAPNRSNDLHRHAHESLFVALDGAGELVIGEMRVPFSKGDVAFVPRWVMHQIINTSMCELVMLTITDFGFTAAVLGECDERTRLAG